MEPPVGCDEDERHLFLRPALFEQQMADLARRGFRSLSLDDFARSNDRSVLITFDDGYAHVMKTVTPILERFGFTAVMFVPAGYLGGYNEADANDHPRLGALRIVDAEQVREMAAGPWEIASHGMRHLDLEEMDSVTRLQELTAAREQLSDITGRRVDSLAYPYGRANDVVEEATVQAGYRQGFIAWPAPPGNALRIPRYPVAGIDGMNMFRLKTSDLYRRMHPLYARVPAGARETVRAVLNRAPGATH